MIFGKNQHIWKYSMCVWKKLKWLSLQLLSDIITLQKEAFINATCNKTTTSFSKDYYCTDSLSLSIKEVAHNLKRLLWVAKDYQSRVFYLI